MCLLSFTHSWKCTIYVCKRIVLFYNSKLSYANLYGIIIYFKKKCPPLLWNAIWLLLILIEKNKNKNKY